MIWLVLCFGRPEEFTDMDFVASVGVPTLIDGRLKAAGSMSGMAGMICVLPAWWLTTVICGCCGGRLSDGVASGTDAQRGAKSGS